MWFLVNHMVTSTQGYYQHCLKVFVNLPQTVTEIDSPFFKIKINTKSQRKNESVNQKHSRVVNFMFDRLFECWKNKTAGNYKSSAGNYKTAGNFKITPLTTSIKLHTTMWLHFKFFEYCSCQFILLHRETDFNQKP